MTRTTAKQLGKVLPVVALITLLAMGSIAHVAYAVSGGTRLSSPNPQAGGEFGYSVAISGTTVIVGAPAEDADTTTAAAGHAYLFDATTGDLISTLTSTDPQDGEIFGFSVGVFVDDATVIVGAPGVGDQFFRGAAPRGILDITTVFGGHAYLF